MKLPIKNKVIYGPSKEKKIVQQNDFFTFGYMKIFKKKTNIIKIN